MRNSLFGVAAKCFGMGGDKEQQRLAQAHEQALKVKYNYNIYGTQYLTLGKQALNMFKIYSLIQHIIGYMVKTRKQNY